MGLPTRGRRCQLGSLHGPMNHESINGTHPAMLAAQDAILMYNYFTTIKESHCCCHCKCLIHKDKVMVEAMQMAHDAQAGHACYYCTKRQHEVKECCQRSSHFG